MMCSSLLSLPLQPIDDEPPDTKQFWPLPGSLEEKQTLLAQNNIVQRPPGQQMLKLNVVADPPRCNSTTRQNQPDLTKTQYLLNQSCNFKFRAAPSFGQVC